MLVFLWIMVFITTLLVVCFRRTSLLSASIALSVVLLVFSSTGEFANSTLMILWSLLLLVLLPLNIVPLRRHLISRFVMRIFKKIMPNLSDTERQALASGTVVWSGDLFSGKPDWEKFKKFPLATLSEEENRFLNTTVEELCSLIDDWQITQSKHLPENVLHHIEENGYFGLIIPKKYGGKEFSAAAHSQIISKIGAVSTSISVIVGVPNSLGPAELLLHYGTEQQKDYYLPRLARGEEIPCFGLTSALAGSDASSMQDMGILFEGEFDGVTQLMIKLNFSKRYITLAPIATLIGLAFRLYDPDHLLGDQDEIGITCALIPADTSGLEVGEYHLPLHSAFPNGPVVGRDVVIPVDWIIGGVENAGQGWKMLMECLAAGRAITLPSLMVGCAKLCALTSGAYARIRRQFNAPIGNFGGIEEVLAQVGGFSYIVNALRDFTVAMIDQGEKPVVASAISKYHSTEMGRRIMIGAMDIHAGKGICMGPNNYMAQKWIEAPIGITVEGANILTRAMIIFGQGAIRCHPYILDEMQAVLDESAHDGLIHFDKAFFAHAGFYISNTVRSLLLGLSHGFLAEAPNESALAGYYRQVARFSAVLGFVADFTMIVFGGALKRMERVSARLGDLLSTLYMASAVIKHFEIDSNPGELPVAHWALQTLMVSFERALEDFLRNFPIRWARVFMRTITMPFGRQCHPPGDQLDSEIARLLQEPSALRQCLMRHVYAQQTDNNFVANLDKILRLVIEIEPLEKKVISAVRAQKVSGRTMQEKVHAAQEAGVITEHEAERWRQVDAMRMEVIRVDDFPSDALS